MEFINKFMRFYSGKLSKYWKTISIENYDTKIKGISVGDKCSVTVECFVSSIDIDQNNLSIDFLELEILAIKDFTVHNAMLSGKPPHDEL